MTKQEKILIKATKKDMEMYRTDYSEAYYSPRYGWTLRKRITEDKKELKAS